MENAFIQTDKNKSIKFRNFSISYNNLESAEQTIVEIFNDLPYQFISKRNAPFIIDAGSDIGIATLFFKELYPHAKILCFEPDPNAFQLLQTNVANNNIENTTLVNAALSRKKGEIDFFGQLLTDSPDARGNSIIETWGLQRTISHTIKVKSVKLSSYIDSEVDFLKLDIEGAEQQVLEELEKENKLSFIQEMALEVHQSDKIKHLNDVKVIIDLLERNKFSLEITEKNTNDLLPEHIQSWVKKMNPHLFAIRAKKL